MPCNYSTFTSAYNYRSPMVHRGSIESVQVMIDMQYVIAGFLFIIRMASFRNVFKRDDDINVSVRKVPAL
ncbi:hypothetical protein TNCV_3223331 [Trichonephila clavipes]|nr:hypothetical protein TNCV_3223331 [Trichonephila clavipes]